MNPSVTADDADAYLRDLQPHLLVTSESSPAAAVARRLGIDLVDPEHLGERREAGTLVPADPTSVALLLPTSGTTGRPKVVPLTHANLTGSARNIAASLQLTSTDRCLGMMPYYHIHGLMAGLLAPLAAGGSVIAAGGFDPKGIRSWLEDLEPSWYTGVPAIHRAVLDSLRRESPLVHHLRFVRSSSAALAPQLMKELERALGVPVIEAYGMTEASHQIATNPLPPGPRQPGTVGAASGTTIAILTDAVVHTDPDRVGEVVIKGPGVVNGYRENPAATAEAFHDGWFRTGDLGQVDYRGYLRLVGRLKEIINRGGEKVAPQEVEEILLSHPAIAQAVAFPYAHPTLGEDVAAVVVVHPGENMSVAELIRFAAARLAAHKVPRHILVTDEIPVSGTGKYQRHRMAEQLGLTDYTDSASIDSHGSVLASIWGESLRLAHIPRNVNFFALGGDSLRAMDLITSLAERFGRVVPLTFFTEGPATLSDMEAIFAGTGVAVASEVEDDGASVYFAEEGALVRSSLNPDGALGNIPIGVRPAGPLDQPGATSTDETCTSSPSHLVMPMRLTGSRAPVFLIFANPAGAVSARFVTESLDAGRVVHALAPIWSEVDSLQQVVDQMTDTVVAETGSGLVHLVGHSLGGLVVYEMAGRLEAAGRRAGALVLIDTVVPHLPGRPTYRRRLRPTLGVPALWRKAHRVSQDNELFHFPIDETGALARGYRPTPLRRPMDLLTTAPSRDLHGGLLGWDEIHQGRATWRPVPGEHLNVFQPPHVHALARLLHDCLETAESAQAMDAVY